MRKQEHSQNLNSQRYAKKLTGVQCCFSISGLILFGSSFLVFRQKGGNLVPIAEILGLSMLVVGCFNIFIYYRHQKDIQGVHWLLADGMSTAALSLFLLFSQMIQPMMVPFFFGVWELFSGILKVIDSKELKEDGIHGWLWFSSIGSIEVLSGIASLLKPIDDLMGINVVVAIIFFVQGSSYFFKILVYPRLVKTP